MDIQLFVIISTYYIKKAKYQRFTSVMNLLITKCLSVHEKVILKKNWLNQF